RQGVRPRMADLALRPARLRAAAVPGAQVTRQAVQSAQRVSACLLISMCPPRPMLPHELTSVSRTHARHGIRSACRRRPAFRHRAVNIKSPRLDETVSPSTGWLKGLLENQALSRCRAEFKWLLPRTGVAAGVCRYPHRPLLLRRLKRLAVVHS